MHHGNKLSIPIIGIELGGNGSLIEVFGADITSTANGFQLVVTYTGYNHFRRKGRIYNENRETFILHGMYTGRRYHLD